MKGDFSRGHTPDRKRGQKYRRVLLQQGRVLLDSDVAASVDAQDRLLRELAGDVGCAMGSPDLGFIVTPGPLFALFETLDRVSGLPDPGAPFRAFRDHAVKVRGRYPTLYLDGTVAAGQVQITGRVTISSAEYPALRVWAQIPAGVSLTASIGGQLVPFGVGMGASVLHPYDIDLQAAGLTSVAELTLGFSASTVTSEAWIGLVEGLRSIGAGDASIFHFTSGRFYLDGLQVEQRPDDGSYPESTYPVKPDFQPPSVGDYVVAYLEGWERPITAVEDPGILEQALGGAIDTTIRTHAVGQVKVATVATGGLSGAQAIGNGVPGAFESIDRGDATLVVTTTPSGSDPDPCAIPAVGGYTGAENRLYRFEVHTGFDLGNALIKWSRDNGAGLHAVTVDDAPNGLVTVLGSSSVQDGDLVELLHEAIDLGDQLMGAVDLGAASFTPAVRRMGTLYYAATTSKTSQVQLLDRITKVPASLTAVASAPGLELRRWSGLCDTAKDGGTSSFDLGDGVTITLGGSGFLPGDYWQYEARRQRDNANGPWQASPHGPERLFTPLALLRRASLDGPLALERWFEHQYSALCELEADDIAYDGDKAETTASTVQEALDELFTREPIVVNGCGEIIVHPDSDLQTIFDSIADGQDARVCIHPGTWSVTQTVVVADKGNLMVGGAGRSSVLESQSLSQVLRFERCASVHLHDLSVHGAPTVVGGAGLAGALAVVDCPQVELERLHVATGAGPGPRRHVCGIQVATRGDDAPSARVRIRGCDVEVGHGQVGILVVDAEKADIEGNEVVCPELPWSLAEHLDDDADAVSWAGAVLMDRFALYDSDRFASDLFLGSSVVVLPAEGLPDAGLAPDPRGRPTLLIGLNEWTNGKVTSFTVHPLLGVAELWDTLLTANPMTGWNSHRADGSRVIHPDGWVLSNLRRLRRDLLRAGLGQESSVELGTVSAPFTTAANRIATRSAVTAGGQGIVVGGRRTPRVGDAFTTVAWNTMYTQEPRGPSVGIIGNRVLGFTQGIHVGTSHNRGHADRDRRLRSYRARIHDNEVQLRVPALARERHGVFVGNAHSVQVRDNVVELVHPGIETWPQQAPTDGIRLWGSYGPMVQVRGNHTVGVSVGIRFFALNPHIGTNGGTSWKVEDNAYAGMGEAVLSNVP